jgi:hypothetical protein
MFGIYIKAGHLAMAGFFISKNDAEKCSDSGMEGIIRPDRYPKCHPH